MRSQKHPFYRNVGKRLLDVTAALTGLIVLAPLLLFLALAVKCGSRGSVFFLQERVGRSERIFKMWKFRSMISGTGPLITASGDPRVTGIGKYLRRWKLDELPQLWNVLIGDMSLVGPRPELPLYVRDYTLVQRQVFTVRPGITDEASLEYRNEEEILAAAPDRERFYKDVVLPHKLSLNLAYVQALSLRLDLKLILMTMKIIPYVATPKKYSADPSDDNSVLSMRAK